MRDGGLCWSSRPWGAPLGLFWYAVLVAGEGDAGGEALREVPGVPMDEDEGMRRSLEALRCHLGWWHFPSQALLLRAPSRNICLYKLYSGAA